MDIWQIIKSFFANYGPIKLILLSFIVYLFYIEFYLIFVNKPTQSSVQETILSSEFYPNIFICQDPSYNASSIKYSSFLFTLIVEFDNLDIMDMQMAFGTQMEG